MLPRIAEVLKNEQITGLTSLKTLSPPTGKSVYHITLQAVGGNVRFTDDGTTNPTATVGQILYDGHPPFKYDGDFTNLKFFAQSGTPVLWVFYYG
jgi:hypothetical protein